MLLSTAYLPPLQWFALAAVGMQASVEACERYQKQSYRNRCYILGPQGVQMLQVPVVHSTLDDSLSFAKSGSAAEGNIRRVLVDYSTPWVVRTQRALDTAYESSAFFEYYRDGLFDILSSQPSLLWDLNMQLTRWCLDRLHLPVALTPTASFLPPSSDPALEDYRYAIHPKRPDTVLQDLGLGRPYYQVFRDRMGGFTPGLSVLDLLFNEGPDASAWLVPVARKSFIYS